jgi:predicted amidohydrolase
MLDLRAWQVETAYDPSQGDMGKSAASRLSVLGALLRPMTNSPNSCLFAAPEFLLRDPTNFFQTVQGKNAILDELKKLSAQFPKILIMPGTIPWLEAVQSDVCKEMYRAYLSSKFPVKTKSAKAFHDELNVHIRAELERLARTNQVYLARNTLYCLKNGRVVYTYHKRFEALGQEIPEDHAVKFDRSIFFPPQSNSPYFVDEDDALLYGVEICADHEYNSLGQALEFGNVDVHVLLSDEVYPVREHTPPEYLVHAGRGTAGVYRREALPSIDNDDIDYLEELLRKESIANRIENIGVVHVAQLNFPVLLRK